MAHKATAEVSAFDTILDTADELVGLVNERTLTPDSASVALGIALGKVCATFDLHLETCLEIVRKAHQETRRRAWDI